MHRTRSGLLDAHLTLVQSNLVSSGDGFNDASYLELFS